MKKIILAAILTTSIFADDYLFEVDNPTMGEAYFDIFNGISALMQNTAYGNLLYLIFILGGFFVFTYGVIKVIQGSDAKAPITDFFKYMLAGTALMLLVVPDPSDSDSMSTLVVESEILPTYYCEEEFATGDPVDAYSGYTVQMPATLAFLYSTMNTIGKETTEIATAVYDNGADTNVVKSLKHMSASGFGGGLRTAEALFKTNFSTVIGKEYLTTNQTGSVGNISNEELVKSYLNEWVAECVYMSYSPNSKDGNMIKNGLDTTANMKATLNDLYTNDQLYVYTDIAATKSTLKKTFTPETSPKNFLFAVDMESGSTAYTNCGTFWKEYLYPALTTMKSDNLACHAYKDQDITPGGIKLMTGSDAMTNAAMFNEIAIQHGMINVHQGVQDGLNKNGSFNYSTGKSQAEFILQNAGMGTYMAQMLPYLQMGIRAVLYAFFPFVFLVMLLPGGFGVIKNYFQTMLWVELWSPVAAILNMFLGYFQMSRMEKIYESGANAAAVSTLASDANMLASVGGYLYASVPALTWLILKGSAQMLGSISQGMASGFAKNLDSNVIRNDMKDMSKSNAMNKELGTENSMTKNLMKLEQLSAAAEGGSMGKVLSHLGEDRYLQGKIASNAQQETKKISAAENTTLQAKEAAGAKESLEEYTALTSSGILNADGSINEKELKRLSEGKGTEVGSKLRQTAKEMSFLAKQLGHDLSTKEGQQALAKDYAQYKANSTVGDVSKQLQKWRDHAENNNVKINGKHASQATNAEIIKYGMTAQTDIGSTEGSKSSYEHEESEQKLVANEKVSNPIKSESDMRKAVQSLTGSKLTDYKQITDKHGQKFHVGRTEDGTVLLTQNGRIMRQIQSTVGQGDKTKATFDSLDSSQDLSAIATSK